MTLTVPCLFGLESLVADEMRRLNLKDVRAENGRVHCDGTLADIARLAACPASSADRPSASITTTITAWSIPSTSIQAVFWLPEMRSTEPSVRRMA